MENLITKPTTLLLKVIGDYISEGDTVIDGTAGNGHDTLALAKLVGAAGKVYAFDIQEIAIDNTNALLVKEGFFDRCELILGSHGNMKELLPKGIWGEVSAAVFNLGYLPGGAKELTTQAADTLEAIRQSLDLIRRGGIVGIAVYCGHSGGAEEKQALLNFSAGLPQKEYHTAYISFINQQNMPPELLLITKK